MNRLSLEVVCRDGELIEIECNVATDGWSGITRAWTQPDDIQKFACAAKHFAETLLGPAEWETGADNGIGLIGLRFYTINRAGRICCQVRLASKAAETNCRPEEVWGFTAELPTESGFVIAFAKQLAEMVNKRRGRAELEGRLA
jgi:hypothetical protein